MFRFAVFLCQVYETEGNQDKILGNSLFRMSFY